MVVSEEPVFETAAFPNFIEKVRQGIPVPSRFMRKFICRLRLNEVSRQ
jgi:hypothetical protein